jgi:signal transduction histidine kinase
MSDHFSTVVGEVQAIGAVPRILETVASLTGLGFVAIAHVTENSWSACAVLDRLDFGLRLGGGLDVSTTLCEEVRASGEAIIIDSVKDSERYREHHTPRIYGFQSYFSIPIFRPNGVYFGTLCGLDPQPRTLSTPATIATLELFAELISQQLEDERVHADTRTALLSERETSELREQFIAVLGHDLRTPLSAVQHGIEILKRKDFAPEILPTLNRMQRSVDRMSSIVDDVVDFTRGRMGGGITLAMQHTPAVDLVLRQIVDELSGVHPEHQIIADIPEGIDLLCDAGRLGQLLSNLLKNAIVHGDPCGAITVSASLDSDRFRMAVSNKGKGLSPDLIQQLFKPFQRASASTAHDGLGLGLYIVDEIAKSHGGKMDVSSVDGMISFTFTMPVHRNC